MKDTGFSVPAEKIDRLPPATGPIPTGKLLIFDEARGDGLPVLLFSNPAPGVVSTSMIISPSAG